MTIKSAPSGMTEAKAAIDFVTLMHVAELVPKEQPGRSIGQLSSAQLYPPELCVIYSMLDDY